VVFLIVIWAFAFSGILLKISFTGKFDRISTIIYVLMGWVGIIAIKPLLLHLPMSGLLWLLAGGTSYTVGAVFYIINRISFNHFIFHIFVLFGSLCHFLAVYFYLL